MRTTCQRVCPPRRLLAAQISKQADDAYLLYTCNLSWVVQQSHWPRWLCRTSLVCEHAILVCQATVKLGTGFESWKRLSLFFSLGVVVVWIITWPYDKRTPSVVRYVCVCIQHVYFIFSFLFCVVQHSTCVCLCKGRWFAHNPSWQEIGLYIPHYFPFYIRQTWPGVVRLMSLWKYKRGRACAFLTPRSFV